MKGPKLMPMQVRFWGKVDKSGDCWLWTGATNTGNGYGRFMMRSRKPKFAVVDYAHRASWFIVNGFIPDGMFVCHRCDNPKCVRPSHLFLGRHEENMQDMASKGRHVGSRKLSNQDVLAVHQMRREGISNKVIAATFSLTRTHVSKILNGHFWKELSA